MEHALRRLQQAPPAPGASGVLVAQDALQRLRSIETVCARLKSKLQVAPQSPEVAVQLSHYIPDLLGAAATTSTYLAECLRSSPTSIRAANLGTVSISISTTITNSSGSSVNREEVALAILNCWLRLTLVCADLIYNLSAASRLPQSRILSSFSHPSAGRVF